MVLLASLLWLPIAIILIIAGESFANVLPKIKVTDVDNFKNYPSEIRPQDIFKANQSYEIHDSLQLSPDFHLEWIVDMRYEIITFIATVKTLGWVGLGLSEHELKYKSDGIVGGVDASRGVTYFEDIHFGWSDPHPIRDALSNWQFLSAIEKNGVTTLEFWRTFKTSDVDEDVIITNEPIYLTWAFHPTSDSPLEIAHSTNQRGSVLVNLLPQATEAPTTEIPTTPSPPDYITKELQLSPDVYLRYVVDLKNARIYFLVQAGGVGWIGFGISTSGSKKSADIILGGINTDGKHYFHDAHFNSIGVVPVADLDATNWNYDYGFERDGVTVLEFSRDFNTGDIDGDIMIKDEEIDLIWAFHPTSDSPFELSSRHTDFNRGLHRVNLLDYTTLSDCCRFPKYDSKPFSQEISQIHNVTNVVKDA